MTRPARWPLALPGPLSVLALPPSRAVAQDGALHLRRGLATGAGTPVASATLTNITSAPPFAGTAADPLLHGAFRLRSATGSFDQRFEFPKENWDYLRDPAENRGYRDRASAVRSVVVTDGRLTKVQGGGPDFQASLPSDPNQVEVSLILGNHRYCMGFGGDTSWDAEQRFVAQNAPPPGACPPSDSFWGSR
jgi:hypothetical protein